MRIPEVALAVLLASSAHAGNFYRPIYANTEGSTTCIADECIVEVPRPPGGWKIAGWKLGAEFGRNDVVRCNSTLYFDTPRQLVDHFNRESLNAPGQQAIQWLPEEAYYMPASVWLGSRTKEPVSVETGCRASVWIYSEKPKEQP